MHSLSVLSRYDIIDVAMSHDELKINGLFWLLILGMLVVTAGAVHYFESKRIDLGSMQMANTDKGFVRQPRIYTVFYQDGVFSPTNIHVHLGDSVKFQNNGANPIYISHQRNTGDPLGLDSGSAIISGNSFTYAFNSVGTYPYYNNFNDHERGTIIVRQ